jgi:hypothetical protein
MAWGPARGSIFTSESMGTRVPSSERTYKFETSPGFDWKGGSTSRRTRYQQRGCIGRSWHGVTPLAATWAVRGGR